LFDALSYGLFDRSKKLLGIPVSGLVDPNLKPITNPNATIKNLEENSSGNGFLHFLVKFCKLGDDNFGEGTVSFLTVKSIINALLEKGADLNHQNGNGNTPLHVAVLENKSDIVKFLLEKGAETNIKNKKEETPLDIAKKNKVKEIIDNIEEYTPASYKVKTKPFNSHDLTLTQNPMNIKIGGKRNKKRNRTIKRKKNQ
jgi:ankyrin repeat protein